MTIRARVRVMSFTFLVLGLSPAACHKPATVQSKPRVARDTARVIQVARDTARVTPVVNDTAGIGAIFKDTAPANVFGPEGRTFNPQMAAQREAFRTALRKERDLWHARKLRDYRFLLRVDCFCPGTRGWLFIEVRNGTVVRARDRAGKSVALADWNTFTIDWLYDNLARSNDNYREVRIAFDQRWHFPTYVRTTSLPGPDAWSIIELRGFRPA